MALHTLTQGSTSDRSGDSTVLVDYDDVAQTVGVTATGPAHIVLTLIVVSTGQVLGAVACDQFKAAGVNDGQRHIVSGPGAVGTQTNGQALSTQPVPSSVIDLVAPPKGTAPKLEIDITW